MFLEPLEAVETKYIKRTNGPLRRQTRSLIHPQYAKRFIRAYIIDQHTCQDTIIGSCNRRTKPAETEEQLRRTERRENGKEREVVSSEAIPFFTHVSR